MAYQRTAPPLEKIQLTTLNSSVYGMARSDRGEMDVSAPYQRGSVWTVEQRQALIRSLLLGVPIGAIIRAKGDARADGPLFRVVDGKQRLEALWAFVDDVFAVPADWFADTWLDLAVVPADGMVLWSQLSQAGRRMFSNLTMSVIEFEPSIMWIEVEPGTGTNGNNRQFNIRYRTADEIVAYESEVFLLINAAGVAQSDETLVAAAAIAAGPTG